MSAMTKLGKIGGLFSASSAKADHVILRELSPVDRERKAYVDGIDDTLSEYKNALKRLQSVVKRLCEKASASSKAEQQFAGAISNCAPESLRVPARFQYTKVISDLGTHFEAEAVFIDSLLVSKLTQRLQDQLNSLSGDLDRIKDLRRQHDKAFEELSHLIGRRDSYTKANFAKIKMEDLYKLCKDISKAHRVYSNILDEVELRYLEIELNVLKGFMTEYRMYLSYQRDLCAQIHQSSLTQFFGTADILEWCRQQEGEFIMMTEERIKHDEAEDEDKEFRREKQFVQFLASNEMCRCVAEYSRKDPAVAKSVLFPGINFLCECFEIPTTNVNAFTPDARPKTYTRQTARNEIMQIFDRDFESFLIILRQPQYSIDTLMTLSHEIARYRISLGL